MRALTLYTLVLVVVDVVNCVVVAVEDYCFLIYIMVEPLLFGIVMGMMAVSLAGLFVAAYLQYRRGQDTQSLI